MNRVFLGSLSAAALALGAQTAFAEQHTGGGSGSGQMATVTCEEFLALPAQDQEMHATALTTASMGDMGGSSDAMSSGEGDSGAMSSDGGESGSMSSDSSGSDTMESGSGGSSTSSDEMATDSGSSESGMSGDSSESMASDGSGGDSMSSDMQQSPTVVALVTICENTSSGMGGGSGMDGSSSESGSSN